MLREEYSDKANPLFCQLYDDLKKENTKIAKKTFDLLDREMFNVVITEGTRDRFNFEVSTYGRLPSDVYGYVKRYIVKNYQFKYVYGD